ncbi:uncharacterized protein BP5553_09412 [Venustampulla echinocandica]|uniref:HIT domain-containing protein n=1 Tax=Venustampulla echinocandica TaxID=2656787 RepID=A0A370TCM3_9HELO|nr:uncharacterized protein BP5553_09412 [Venustampulla echinocandica]RDL32010.1 hypothetical protein BP5553_09412 [Venustampulla echinocandica]
MAAETDTSQDAITREEIAGTAPSPSPSSTRNAFTTLMAPKSKRPSVPPTSSSSSKKRGGPFFNPRNNLGTYIAHPETANRVIFHNPSFVAIHDLYPKSSVHTLLLPRSAEYNLQHPFDALSHLEFLAQVRAEADKLKDIVAKELRRIYGPYSAQDSKREAILSGEVDLPEGEELPAGRDWEKEGEFEAWKRVDPFTTISMPVVGRPTNDAASEMPPPP